ncbi:MAG TPA: hypothetical protein VF207_05835 [Chthoniobacterales bacterium]
MNDTSNTDPGLIPTDKPLPIPPGSKHPLPVIKDDLGKRDSH